MDITWNYFSLVSLMLASGVVGGLLAGLLGVGGGIVVVPVLEFTLGILGVDPAIRMHVAVATSLATIIPTSISSARAHHARNSVDLALFRRWGPLMFVGSMLGALLASVVHSAMLSLVFGFVALLVAAKMLLLRDDFRLAPRIPEHAATLGIPVGIGAVSSMMGIGGGTLSVPVLTLLNQPVHMAVGTAALFGLVISIPATLAYILAGWSHGSALPGSLGYVNVVGFLIIAPLTTWIAPYGARLAHRLTRATLTRTFGAFLLMVGIRMIYKALG
jgi:uncharacterized protein